MIERHLSTEDTKSTYVICGGQFLPISKESHSQQRQVTVLSNSLYADLEIMSNVLFSMTRFYLMKLSEKISLNILMLDLKPFYFEILCYQDIDEIAK